MISSMTDINRHSQEMNPDITFEPSVVDTLKEMMRKNINEAKVIYELSLANRLLDSQEFIDWQDELNKISVKYG